MVKHSLYLCQVYDKKVKAMTILSKKKQSKNVRMHINKAYQFLEDNLPKLYVEKTLEKIKVVNGKKKPSSSLIRNVRNGINSSYENRYDILNALVEVAKDNLNEKEALTSKFSA